MSKVRKTAAREIQTVANEGRFAIDRTGQVTEWDAGAAALLGVPENNALNRPCYEVVAEADLFDRTTCGSDCPALRALRFGQLHGRNSVRARERSGSQRRMHCELTATPAPHGGALGRLCRTGKTSASLANDLAGVATLATKVCGASLADGAERTLDFLLNVTTADTAELFLAEPGGASMALTCQQGRCRRAFGQITRFNRGEGFPGLVLAQGEPMYTNHLADDPRYLRTLVKKQGFQSYLCVPLTGSSGVAGALGLAFRRPNAPLERSLWLLYSVGAPLALLVEAERARIELQRAAGANRPARAWSAPSMSNRLVRRERQPVPAAAFPLAVRCLGTFELHVRGKAIASAMVHRKKTLTLLKLLVVHHGHPQSKEALIEALWPDADSDTHTAQFYVLVHELRRLVERPGVKQHHWQFICNQKDLYYLDPESPVWIDAVEFRRLLERGRKAEATGNEDGAVAAYERAVDLYRGEFLADERFAEWCWLEREQLRETCLGALKRLSELLARREMWDNSIPHLQHALLLDRVREDLHRELMYALWATGRRSEAVRQYKRCAVVLKQELDVAPMPATRQLLHQIQATPQPDCG